MTIELTGRIDSNNASQVENEIMAQLTSDSDPNVVLDAASLEYMSSAGLRILLRILKSRPQARMVNVNGPVYDVLETTGFTKMMPVEKAYRAVSIEGFELFTRSRSGRSLARLLRDEPEKLDFGVKAYVALLKKIHATRVPAGRLPDMRETALSWVGALQDWLPEKSVDKLSDLLQAIPPDDHMLHGDFHAGNLELQGESVLPIATNTLAVGNPIFELAFIYDAFVGRYELNHSAIKAFLDIDFDLASTFWRRALAAYLGTNCPHKLREVEDKARVIGYAKLIRRATRRRDVAPDASRAEIEFWAQELTELLDRTDTLLFDVNELLLEAEDENLEEVQAFVDERLETLDCPMRTQMAIAVAVEELFINIAHYAYAPEHGMAVIRAVADKQPPALTVTFRDWGVPYDPLAKADPDVTLSAAERKIGGLGIYMVKKSMSDMSYVYRDGQNVLTIRKKIE